MKNNNVTAKVTFENGRVRSYIDNINTVPVYQEVKVEDRVHYVCRLELFQRWNNIYQ